MMLTGTIKKQGSKWLAEIRAAGLQVEARTKEDARSAIVARLRELAERPDLFVAVTQLEGDRVLVESPEPGILLAIVLRHQRGLHGLTLHQVAEQLGYASRNQYHRHELGHLPKIDTLTEILNTVAPGVAIALVDRPTK
jgi:hypothetical protein